MQDFDPMPFHNYPMGPTVRDYIDLDEADYAGEQREAPTAAEQAAFTDFLLQLALERAPTSQEQFIDLVEELAGMGLGAVATRLAEAHEQYSVDGDFRGLLALGSAAMLEGDLAAAASYYREAQAIEPAEPAPYVNLARIFYAEERDADALVWAEAGLKADPNHQRLWELIYSLYLVENRDTAKERVRELARRYNSYSGLTLAAELIDPSDYLLKAQYLEELYHGGSRDVNFLVEYTAALGLAGQFEKIPQIVWQAEKLASNKLPWQLYAHVAQSYFARGQEEQALEAIKKLEADTDAPADVKRDLVTTYENEKAAHNPQPLH